jgi:hypothetical protein
MANEQEAQNERGAVEVLEPAPEHRDGKELRPAGGGRFLDKLRERRDGKKGAMQDQGPGGGRLLKRIAERRNSGHAGREQPLRDRVRRLEDDLRDYRSSREDRLLDRVRYLENEIRYLQDEARDRDDGGEPRERFRYRDRVTSHWDNQDERRRGRGRRSR